MSASPTRRPTPGHESTPHSLIKSPLWSSLTSGHDPARAITRHDTSETGGSVASTDVATRLPASGLGVRFPRGALHPRGPWRPTGPRHASQGAGKENQP